MHYTTRFTLEGVLNYIELLPQNPFPSFFFSRKLTFLKMPRISTAILGLVALGVFLVKAESPTVDLTLVAPWTAPDFLLEIA
jgi:hypothetical protein